MPELRGDGVLEWRDDQGLRHREDGPAASYPDGRRIWFRRRYEGARGAGT